VRLKGRRQLQDILEVSSRDFGGGAFLIEGKGFAVYPFFFFFFFYIFIASPQTTLF